MYPNSALSAGQLAIMAVVVVVSLAAWLILVALAARQPRGTSAAADARPREEENGRDRDAASFWWQASGQDSGLIRQGGRGSAVHLAWRPRERVRHQPVHGTKPDKYRLHDHLEV